jgi:hypothetical protein
VLYKTNELSYISALVAIGSKTGCIPHVLMAETNGDFREELISSIIDLK